MDTPEIVTWTIFETYEDGDGYTATKYVGTVLDSNEINDVITARVNNPEYKYRVEIPYTVKYCKLSSYLDVFRDYESRVFIVERETHPIPDYIDTNETYKETK